MTGKMNLVREYIELYTMCYGGEPGFDVNSNDVDWEGLEEEVIRLRALRRRLEDSNTATQWDDDR